MNFKSHDFIYTNNYFLKSSNYNTKGELTLADSDFCPRATPELLMAYEFSFFFTNDQLRFGFLCTVMVKAVASQTQGTGIETVL